MLLFLGGGGNFACKICLFYREGLLFIGSGTNRLDTHFDVLLIDLLYTSLAAKMLGSGSGYKTCLTTVSFVFAFLSF